MTNYIVEIATKEQEDYIKTQLDRYNLESKPMIQEKAFVPFKYTISHEGKVIGGVFAYSSHYKIGYIDTLWIAEDYRNNGLGKRLLNQVENDLSDYGCQIVRLETYDFQGPAFYEKCGYQLFGTLDYPNAELTEYFYSKNLH